MTSDLHATPPAATEPPDVPGVRHRFVTTGDGVRLHVAEAGQGDPVLLLHGFPQHWYAWRRLVPRLAADHRLICLDLRGSGRSEAPATGYDTGTRVRDVLGVLDGLGLDRVRLIGHELGAWTGFMACLRAPERFSHHLALNVIHPWPLQRRLLPQAWRYWYTAPLELPLLGRTVLTRAPAFTRFLLRRGVAASSARDLTAEAEFARSTAEPDRARAAEALHRHYALRDIPAMASGRWKNLRLTVPTVILAGGRDPFLPPGVLTPPQHRTDHLHIDVLPEHGHFLHEEHPEAVARSARELFARE